MYLVAFFFAFYVTCMIFVRVDLRITLDKKSRVPVDKKTS
jgi:hypothetical protein